MTLGTAVVGLVVIGIVFLAGRSLYRSKKNGSACAGCSGCSGADHGSECHCEETK